MCRCVHIRALLHVFSVQRNATFMFIKINTKIDELLHLFSIHATLMFIKLNTKFDGVITRFKVFQYNCCGYNYVILGKLIQFVLCIVEVNNNNIVAQTVAKRHVDTCSVSYIEQR